MRAYAIRQIKHAEGRQDFIALPQGHNRHRDGPMPNPEALAKDGASRQGSARERGKARTAGRPKHALGKTYAHGLSRAWHGDGEPMVPCFGKNIKLIVRNHKAIWTGGRRLAGKTWERESPCRKSLRVKSGGAEICGANLLNPIRRGRIGSGALRGGWPILLRRMDSGDLRGKSPHVYLC